MTAELSGDVMFSKPEPGSPKVWAVGVYDCNRLFGGREEGGWWFDAGDLVRQVRQFRNERRAHAYGERLNKRLQSRAFGPNQGKREYTSVLSDGEYQAFVFGGVCPAYFPAERPHYE